MEPCGAGDYLGGMQGAWPGGALSNFAEKISTSHFTPHPAQGVGVLSRWSLVWVILICPYHPQETAHI